MYAFPWIRFLRDSSTSQPFQLFAHWLLISGCYRSMSLLKRLHAINLEQAGRLMPKTRFSVPADFRSVSWSLGRHTFKSRVHFVVPVGLIFTNEKMFPAVGTRLQCDGGSRDSNASIFHITWLSLVSKAWRSSAGFDWKERRLPLTNACAPAKTSLFFEKAPLRAEAS